MTIYYFAAGLLFLFAGTVSYSALRTFLRVRFTLNITELSLTDPNQEFIEGYVRRVENGQKWLTGDYKQLTARLDAIERKKAEQAAEAVKA